MKVVKEFNQLVAKIFPDSKDFIISLINEKVEEENGEKEYRTDYELEYYLDGYVGSLAKENLSQI